MSSEPSYPVPAKAISIFTSLKRFIVLYGGRGSGKSWTVARFLILRALKSRVRILCTRENQNSIKDSVYRLLVDQIVEMGFTKFFDITKDAIVCKNGSEFLFKGLRYNIAEIKSTEGVNLVWAEEAEKISQDSWDILIPTIREEGSQFFITFNPDDEKAPTFKRFVLSTKDDTLLIKMNWQDNFWFPNVLRGEMEYDKKNDYEKYLYVWEGNPKRYGQAVIFKNKIEIREFESPAEDTQYYVGMDFGYSVDPTAIVQMFIKDYCLYIDEDFYAHHIEIEQLPQAMNSLSAIKRGFHIVADSARPDTISHLQNKGFNIDGAEKGAGSVEDGIGFLKSFEKIVIHPRCKGTISDFENYRWKQDRITQEILPIALDKSNHSIDACRYSLEAYFKGGLSIFEVMPKLAGV